jgi:spermidine synthase
MRISTWRVAALLFGSGLSALVYQTSWFRELRLVFGSSTAASAAVLAIFMGGLGLGGALLGRRADRSSNPLRMYARLEFGIAISAALTPFLVELIREVYIRLGGSASLGLTGASLVRIALTALVLGVPTVLMGGTLPAAARAVESVADAGRRKLAVLYGANTIGAVAGAVIATFALLELYGNRRTLWIAALLNLLVAVIAQSIARSAAALPEEHDSEVVFEEEPAEPESPAADMRGRSPVPYGFVLAAAAAVGFIFFVMELVWYRMLSPLLGGSTFTFGLILAVALFGIGLGGFVYSLFGQSRPATLLQFAITCGAEAILIAVPFAIGDRIAVLAIFLRELGRFGFEGQVAGWGVIAAIVILPAALVAGFQFPLLIGLLGRGSRDIGRDAGLAYAFNTLGAIAGALAGGFGILPLLSATGTWRAVVFGLALLCLITIAMSLRSGLRSIHAVPLAFAAAACALVLTLGPTAAWRHSPIGAGREVISDDGKHSIQRWLRIQRQGIAWDVDGIESTVALSGYNGYAFLVNGKSDGHARFDSGTQVMAGLLGIIAVERPADVFVVGLGTGSTAGWLAVLPQVERVDVAELEPAILHVARACEPVNAGVLSNPKVNIQMGDAREILLTGRKGYDIIFSEPSNPYRAGVATLFTRDFYQTVETHLNEGGVFIHWLQAYEIEPVTVRTVYTTLLSVFPAIQTWQSQSGDLVLIASREEPLWQASALRSVVESGPFSTAMANTWRTTSLEGLAARYVGGTPLARALANDDMVVPNTDDRNLVEFHAARSVGGRTRVDPDALRGIAEGIGTARPPIEGDVDWDRVIDERFSINTVSGHSPAWPSAIRDPKQRARIEAHQGWIEGRPAAARTAWEEGGLTPLNGLEVAIEAELGAADPGGSMPAALEELSRIQPAEAAAIRARWFWVQNRPEEAVAELGRAFLGYRKDPWPMPAIMGRAIALAELIATSNPALAEGLYPALSEPFAVRMLDNQRKRALISIARVLGPEPCNPRTVASLEAFEPWFPWERDLLSLRSRCYREAGHPLGKKAESELIRYLRDEPDSLLPQ